LSMMVSMATDASTLHCPSCAAIVMPGAAWCGLCHKPMPAEPAASAGVFAPSGGPVVPSAGSFRAAAPAPSADLFSESRWRGGSLTFGPVGRVVLTLAVLLPYPLFIVNLPFGLVGIVVWTAIVPRAMRDIWARDRRHHLPPPG
jgi:hypothetical protein